jgi:hypothetical protein
MTNCVIEKTAVTTFSPSIDERFLENYGFTKFKFHVIFAFARNGKGIFLQKNPVS